MSYPEVKNYVCPPEVRAVLAQVKREQRARAKKRAEAAKGFGAQTATAPTNPTIKGGIVNKE